MKNEKMKVADLYIFLLGMHNFLRLLAPACRQAGINADSIADLRRNNKLKNQQSAKICEK